jgi:hypothetical protein
MAVVSLGCSDVAPFARSAGLPVLSPWSYERRAIGLASESTARMR